MAEPALRPWTVEEFLAWEREQPERWEFDGVQPVPRGMVGGSRPHARLSARLVVALAARLPAECEAYGADLKVVAAGHIRYPDAMVECGKREDAGDVALPVVVFEVLSPSTAATDRRVKAMEYRAEAYIHAIVLLEQDQPAITVMRRSAKWQEEVVVGLDAVLALPEVGIEVPLTGLYGRRE